MYPSVSKKSLKMYQKIPQNVSKNPSKCIPNISQNVSKNPLKCNQNTFQVQSKMFENVSNFLSKLAILWCLCFFLASCMNMIKLWWNSISLSNSCATKFVGQVNIFEMYLKVGTFHISGEKLFHFHLGWNLFWKLHKKTKTACFLERSFRFWRKQFF